MVTRLDSRRSLETGLCSTPGERGLISRTVAGNRAQWLPEALVQPQNFICIERTAFAGVQPYLQHGYLQRAALELQFQFRHFPIFGAQRRGDCRHISANANDQFVVCEVHSGQ